MCRQRIKCTLYQRASGPTQADGLHLCASDQPLVRTPRVKYHTTGARHPADATAIASGHADVPSACPPTAPVIAAADCWTTPPSAEAAPAWWGNGCSAAAKACGMIK